jgi:hypothetical protein
MTIEIVDVLIRIAIVLATGFLFGVVFLTYFRFRNRKTLLVSMGFGIFFVHAIVYLPELFNAAYSIVVSENVHLLIHLIGLIFIVVGMLKD